MKRKNNTITIPHLSFNEGTGPKLHISVIFLLSGTGIFLRYSFLSDSVLRTIIFAQFLSMNWQVQDSQGPVLLILRSSFYHLLSLDVIKLNGKIGLRKPRKQKQINR